MKRLLVWPKHTFRVVAEPFLSLCSLVRPVFIFSFSVVLVSSHLFVHRNMAHNLYSVFRTISSNFYGPYVFRQNRLVKGKARENPTMWD